MASNDLRISAKTASCLIGIERNVLPVIYGLLAWQRLEFIDSQLDAYSRLETQFQTASPLHGIYFVSLIKHLLLFALMVFTGLTLLLNRAPTNPPDKLKHVVVPLATSFYFVLYGIVDYFPASLRESILPESWQPQLAVFGLLLSILGYSISIWALCYLRRSFALLVAVRTIVLRGPYASVRHPIYLGYTLDLLGLLLVTGSLGILILGAGFVMLMVCRARIEEEKLSETSKEYRDYINQTGFLFPRWK